MSDLSYDESSIESIFEHALLLTGKSLEDLVELPPDAINESSRGRLGNLVETYFFGIKQNSDQEPDFPKAGLELKVTGILPYGLALYGPRYRAKERLVLTMIDYESLVRETWETSTFLKKSARILIVFYLYNSSVPETSRVFPIRPLLYEIPSQDLMVIRKDWEFIQEKVKAGKAHELSEGDTFYLAACRKGSGGPKEKLRQQPSSVIGAKSRAFCFKQSYLTKKIAEHLANEISQGSSQVVGESGLGINATTTFEDATHDRFSPYIGKTVHDITRLLGVDSSHLGDKGFYRYLSNKILFNGFTTLNELHAADIELKTIRLNAKGAPREAMSFPRFHFDDLSSQSWDESNFFERLERKFLFVIFKTDETGTERLYKASYWNMPYEDRLEAQRVWEETKKRLLNGETKFPKSSESHVAHVRPKGRNSQDTDTTPHGIALTKQCFWLNKSYIAKVVDGL